MTNELQTKSDYLPEKEDDYNPYIAFGRSDQRIVGKLLKFDKFGEWINGEEGEVLPHGTELIANMGELLIGWIKWEDGKPTEQVMGRVFDNFEPPRRSELGDQDKDSWPIDNNGNARDPWQFSIYLVMKAEGGDELYTYATSSRGGIQAVRKLSNTFGESMRFRTDQFPIVRLSSGFYMHPNKEFGKIKTPKFELVGWASRNEMDNALARRDADGGENVETEAPPPTEKVEPKKAAAPQQTPQRPPQKRVDQNTRF